MTTRALRIAPDGEVSEVSDPNFAGIGEIVGGYVQLIHSADGRTTFWCNEDGKMIGLESNGIATAAWWHYNPAVAKLDFLVGTVVVTGASDGDDIAEIAPEVAEMLTSLRPGQR